MIFSILGMMILAAIFISTGFSKIVSKSAPSNLSLYAYKTLGLVEFLSALLIFAFPTIVLGTFIILLSIYTVFLRFISKESSCNCGGVLDIGRLSRKQSIYRNGVLLTTSIILLTLHFVGLNNFEISLSKQVMLLIINLLVLMNVHMLNHLKFIKKELLS
ncbi:MauE/DoxX family redox-associated membrane protein [Exiguobacterium aurantiacum]|uniref:Methylamine utilisation protein MauE domain-containing protein n=1 Tax=Exiguobacterium aurantiacum TaxID=33987 RepID=A0A377HH14_9BACL|nr:Uncharacterised protein [Exiguobacterium aurantiacum]